MGVGEGGGMKENATTATGASRRSAIVVVCRCRRGNFSGRPSELLSLCARVKADTSSLARSLALSHHSRPTRVLKSAARYSARVTGDAERPAGKWKGTSGNARARARAILPFSLSLSLLPRVCLGDCLLALARKRIFRESVEPLVHRHAFRLRRLE